MEYYCSSPKCRNECGKKEEKIDPERMWRDPQNVQGVLIYYEKFCDDEGHRLPLKISDKQKKLIESKIKGEKQYFV